MVDFMAKTIQQVNIILNQSMSSKVDRCDTR